MLNINTGRVWQINVIILFTLLTGGLLFFQNCAQDSPEARSQTQGTSSLPSSTSSITEDRSFDGAGGTSHNWTITYSPANDSITVGGSWSRNDQTFLVNSGTYNSVSLRRGESEDFVRSGAYSPASSSNFSHYETRFQIRFATDGKVTIGHCSIQIQIINGFVVDHCEENGYRLHFEDLQF